MSFQYPTDGSREVHSHLIFDPVDSGWFIDENVGPGVIHIFRMARRIRIHTGALVRHADPDVALVALNV